MRFAALRGFAAIGFEALARNSIYVRNKLSEHGLTNHAVILHAAMATGSCWAMVTASVRR
jgi:hypothetical protein